MISFSKSVLRSRYTQPLFFAIALFAVSESSYGQIVAWQLNGALGSEVSINASTNNANLNTSTLTRNGSVAISALANSFGSTNYPANGTRADAITNNRGQSFTISAKAGFTVSLSTLDVRFRRSATGPNAFVWRYSIDGVNFIDILNDISYTATNTVGDFQTQINLSGIAALQNVVDGTVITFRLNGWGATGTAGTFSIGRSPTNGASDYSLDIRGTVSPSGITSKQDGAWGDINTWTGLVVPMSADNVIVAHHVTTGAVARNSGTTTSINTGASLAVSNNYICTGATTIVNGTFQLNTGGWVSGMDFTYGTTGTLNFNSGGSYQVNDTDVFWPIANGPFHVNVLQGGLSLNSANRTVAGTFAIEAGVTLSSSTLRLNGTTQINSGGFFNTAPFYGNASTLIYNSGGIYGRGYEWSALGAGTIGVSPGYPNHVQLSGNTAFNYNNGTPLAKAIAGNLTVDAGSGFYMDYSGGASGGTLTIAGHITNAGNFSLGNAIGDDLKVGGDFTNTGSFNGNNRAVYFTKPGVQNLSSIPSITIPYIIFSGGTTVKLAAGTNAVVSAPSGGNAIQFTNSSDVLDINGNTLTIGTSDVANTINGSGTFKGSPNSNLTLKGIGSIGMIQFAGNFNLGTLTVDRQAANVAFTLGTHLTINTSIVFANGLIDLGSSELTLEELVATSGASFNSYIIADIAGSSGTLRKRFTTGNPSFTFPIGDSPASADGSQYSPAIISFEGSTTYSTSTTPSYVSVAVHDIVHPNLAASTDYISRYWSVNRSGTFTNPSYTFTGSYLPIDGAGSIGNCVSNRWNGTSWTDGTAIASNTVSMSGVTELPTALTDNHFSAGYRNQEIHIKGGTGTITNGSTAALGFNNTLFAATNIGASATKSYEIQNLGKATLNLTGTPTVRITGANPGDFVVTLFPSLIAITGGSSASFSITFSPIYSGTRTAIVSIANTDTDENPYTFLVQGTGNCAAASNTITPTSGPVGTAITLTSINAITNNLIGATATFNGIAATVIPISASQIKIIVPAGATSGNLVTTNAQGCIATNYFTVIENAIGTCQGTGVPRAELFISEVTDHGSGSHSYVEIFNASGATVNLLNYTVRIHRNGDVSATNTITLPSYSLATNAVYVLAFGSTDATLNPGGITPNFTNTASGINGNDNIRLYNSSGTWIDLWGNTADVSFTVALKDYVYRRKNTGISAPSTTWDADDWISFSPVDYSNVGFYDFSAGTPPTVTLQPVYSPSCKSTSLTVSGSEGYDGVLDTKELAYQWYGVAPNTASWTIISDGGIYSGASTATLKFSNLAGMDGYKFYCQIRENDTSCYTATNAVTITEAPILIWNGSAWSPSLSSPSLSTIVVINGDYNTSTNGNLNACSIIVNAGKTLEISADQYVNIQNDLTVHGVLRVLDKGSLIMIDDAGIVTNNGTTALHRFTTPFEQYDYTYWSTPIVSSDIATTFARWRTDKAFEYVPANFSDANNDGFDDDGNDWMKAGSMTPGKGYIIMGPTNESTYPTAEEVVFKGKFNNGVITTPIALTPNAATDDDFNLVGNPYPSAISADAFIKANISGTGTFNKTIEGTLYFWTHKQNITALNPGPDSFNYSQNDYAMYNLSGGTGTSGSLSGGTEQSNKPLGYIASGQGFFVEADVAGSLTFNNAMRVGLPVTANSQFYKIQSPQLPKLKDRFWLNMENSKGMFSQQLLSYFGETTTAYDQGYDGSVNEAGNYVSFYSFINEGIYRIQGRGLYNSKDQVRLGYFSAVTGTFTIAIDAKEGVFTHEETPIYLEDKLLQVVHELQQGPYSFNTEKGTYNDRFVLRYTNKLLETSDSLGNINYTIQENQVFVSIKNKQIKINSFDEMIDKVQVFDLSGRQIYQKKNVNSNELTVTNLSASHQVLMVKTVLQNGHRIDKKIIF